jgi:hypothetical protein
VRSLPPFEREAIQQSAIVQDPKREIHQFEFRRGVTETLYS